MGKGGKGDEKKRRQTWTEEGSETEKGRKAWGGGGVLVLKDGMRNVKQNKLDNGGYN